jgi:hypothetical protein
MTLQDAINEATAKAKEWNRSTAIYHDTNAEDYDYTSAASAITSKTPFPDVCVIEPSGRVTWCRDYTSMGPRRSLTPNADASDRALADKMELLAKPNTGLTLSEVSPQSEDLAGVEK